MNKKDYNKFYPLFKWLIIIGIIIILALQYDNILKYVTILTPFWVGLVIAYILNIPMSYIEEQLKKILPEKLKSSNRVFAILIVILVFILFLYLIISIIVPQLFTTISQVVQNSNQVTPAIQELINNIVAKLKIITGYDIRYEIAEVLNPIINSFMINIQRSIPMIINNTLEITSTVFIWIMNFLIGFVISIYLLLSKEKLLLQFKGVLFALIDEKYYKKILKICTTANQTFTSFISGQVLDCIALGSLCYVGMIIFGFPYPLLISVLVTTLSIIPYFGAFTAMFIGSILMLPIDAAKSLYFIIYFVILQQLEGNFVYPRIVGNKVGLPGIWVLVSVILFSGIFGFIGLFFAVPITAVIYNLFREYIDYKLNKKHVKIHEIQEN